MLARIPETPELQPLGQVSPSRLYGLGECALREVWAAARVPAALPSTPAAILGTAIHKLLEEAGEGALAEAAVSDRWESLIDAADRRLEGSLLDRRFAPLRASYPRYEVLRIRAEMRARELIQSRHELESVSAPQRAIEGGTTTVGQRDWTGFELRLESRDGKIVGRLDRVLTTVEGAVIQDYKSGALYVDAAQGAPTIKPQHATQLRLYAALYFEAAGEWPARLELIPLVGEPAVVSFSAAESRELLESAEKLLTEVNDAILSLGQGAQAELARPAPQTCSFCAYRPLCQPYRDARQLIEDESWPSDVWGTLTTTHRVENGQLVLELATESGRVFVRATPDERSHPGLSDIDAGTPLAIFSLRRTSARTTFLDSPRTVVYELFGRQP